RGRRGRSERRNATGDKPIDQAEGERFFGTDDDEIDPPIRAPFGDQVHLARRDWDVLGKCRGTAVARGAVHLPNPRTLAQLPNERVLSRPAADDEYAPPRHAASQRT